MAYDERESSLESGAPLYCYLFRQDAMIYAYTSADRPQEINNIIFESGVQISDDGQRSSGETQASTKSVTLSASSAISRQYREYTPSAAVSLTVWTKHQDDPDYVVSWVGLVMDAAWLDQATCRLNCQTIAAAMNSPGLIRCWQRNCSNVLYDSDCGVAQSSYRNEVVANTIDGLSVYVLGIDPIETPSGYYTGGILEWMTAAGVVERRGIRTHVDNQLVLLGGTAGLPPNSPITIYPGCNLTIQTCRDKFGNEDNYGGQPHQPGRSPFDGNQIF